jgi:hypothetical protein
MEWLASNWPFVAGVGGVFITVGINVQMLRDVVKEARELNGSVDKIIASIASCQSVQKLMLEGRVKGMDE